MSRVFHFEDHFGYHRPVCRGQCLLAQVEMVPAGCPGVPAGCAKNLLPVTVVMVLTPTITWAAYVVRGARGAGGSGATAYHHSGRCSASALT